jgi:hypothetical protein
VVLRVLRLSAPVGLAVAFACLWLPFLLGGASPTGPIGTPVGPSVTYTGMDLVFGGTADIRVVLMRPDGRSYDEVRLSDDQMYGHSQPPLSGSVYGVAAVSLIGAGMLASLVRVARVRAAVTATAALLGALTLLALELAQRREVARLVQPLLGALIGIGSDEAAPLRLVSVRWGFWLAMAMLVVVGFAQVAAFPARHRPAIHNGQLEQVG